MDKRLSVYGLGKLGCTMLACFAHKGWHVIGIDILKSSVDAINQGISPIYEPRVADLIKANRERIRATTDLVQAALDTDYSFIIVPTPSKKDGSFSTEYVENAIKAIGEALKQKETYHLVVVTSTVMPGDTERMKDMLEDISGKTCGQHFGVCYNPDFIALGKIVYDFLNPDMILMGESDGKAGDILEGIHSRLVDNHPEYHRMSFHNAELAKIGLNSYCTLKITYANIIGEICEAMPTGDADKVLAAIGADSRVGKRYFRAGLGFSGVCFPRDNRAFNFNAKGLNVTHTLAGLTDEINNYQKRERIPNLLLSVLREKGVNEISILGVTYKEDVTIVEESPAIDVIRELAGNDIVIRVYDPAGMEAAHKALGECPEIVFTKSIITCIDRASVCFIATPWQEFKDITADEFLEFMSEDPTVFDACGIYSDTDIAHKLDYRRIGKLNTGIKILLPGLEYNT